MRAAIYTRISRDSAETGLGVQRQEQDCRELAGRLGWTIVKVFTDNDTASNGKARKHYSRMIADIEAGQLDAVLVWDVDRLTRQPRELEDFIDLTEARGIQLASVGGEIDLGSVQGQLTARIKGSVAKAEQDQMSRRIRRAHQARAEQGIPHGKPAYGWDRVGTKNEARDLVNPEQAAVIQGAA